MPDTKLDSALAKFTEVPPHFGQGDESQKKQLDQLRRDLKDISLSSSRYFNISVALVVILFIGACAVAVLNFNKPGQITAVFSATGLSFFGIVSFMLKLWREKVNSDTLLALASHLEAGDLRKIAMALLKARLNAKS